MIRKLALIVDGDPIIRLVTSQVCEELGLAVETAGDAADCFDRLSGRGWEFSLVLMDPKLPCGSGRDTVAAIRGLPGASPDRLPIVALNGERMAWRRFREEHAAFDAVVDKPVMVSDLHAVLIALRLA